MSTFINGLGPLEMIRLGGAGNKANRIILGEVDAYVQPRGGLSFWDLCAPDVLVRAVGGTCIDFEGNRLKYPNGVKPTIGKFMVGKTPNLVK